MEKDYLTNFPKFDIGRHFAPKITQFWPFLPKMTYFDQIAPINDIFDQISVHKPDWKNSYKLLGKKLFDYFPLILTYDVILAPKMTQFCPFSPKMTYTDQNWVILGAKWRPMLKFGESGQIIFGLSTKSLET